MFGETLISCLALDELSGFQSGLNLNLATQERCLGVTALHALLSLAMNPRGGRLLSLAKLGFTCQMPTFYWVMAVTYL